MSDVEIRLAALERSVRRWRLGTCFAGVALAAAVAVGAQRRPAEVLDARALRVLADDGREVFAVTEDPDQPGSGILTLRTQGGGVVLIGGSKDGPAIGIKSRRQKVGVRLTATDGGGQLRLFDAREKDTFTAPE